MGKEGFLHSRVSQPDGHISVTSDVAHGQAYESYAQALMYGKANDPSLSRASPRAHSS